MPVPGPSYRRRVFDHLSKIPCEAVMNAKITRLILLALSWIFPSWAAPLTAGPAAAQAAASAVASC